MKTQIIPFNDGKVTVQEHYSNEFTAHMTENYDYDSPMGYGDTMLSAIADLNEKLRDIT